MNVFVISRTVAMAVCESAFVLISSLMRKFKGGHGSAKWSQTYFIKEFGIWMYLKGYDLENLKNMLLHHFEALLPWKQSKMATKHSYFKSLKLQSQCMQINFIFTVLTNIMLFLLLPRILWLLILCFSFIVLSTFYACKNDTNDISNQHKTETNITI